MSVLPLPSTPTTGVLPALQGTGVAVHLPTGTLSHDELGARVDAWAATHLAGHRRLVHLECTNTLDSLVAYLAVLQHGHVGLVTPPLDDTRREDLLAAYAPDLVVADGLVTAATERAPHDLHPDLALLLSTSGSTGSPRLVRLSRDNVRSNAAAIATYLGLGADDVAITSLPLHYCYGLSVLHSHLLVGGSIALTEASVVDPCFWGLAERAGVTTLSAVPHTIDLLDHSGFASRPLPGLRRITQAGGRLAPERVRDLAIDGRRRGFDLVVMYGQTEATARMAWLPPDRAAEAPDAVGIAIPGGSLRIDSPNDSGVGEVVYAGPNVMMGYADSAADLDRGAELSELRTGDLGRIGDDGLLRITGRSSRTAKLFGLRLDLDRVEQQLAVDGSVRCIVSEATGSPGLHVFGTVDDAETLATTAAAFCGLPASVVTVHRIDSTPRTPSGKVDYAALARAAAPDDASGRSAGVRGDFALVLGRPDARGSDSFVSLGGDSLSYVELATRLDQRLPSTPTDWHLQPIEDLEALATPTVRSGRIEEPTTPTRGLIGLVRADTTICLRALAIVLIVASHVDLIMVEGGAHLLLALAGFNFARFQLASPDRGTRVRHGVNSLLQLVVPSMIWIGGVTAVTRDYEWRTVFFVNDWAGGRHWDDNWQYWFLQALVWVSVFAVALIGVPVLHRLERARPLAFALALLGALTVVRFAWVGVHAGPTERYTTPVVAFFFALGWAGARARTTRARLAVSTLAGVLTWGFFGDHQRELVILIGFALMLWVPRVPLPTWLFRVCALLATSSLFIYVTQWQVYPPLEDAGHQWLALWAAFAVGIGYGFAMRPVSRALRRAMRPRAS